MTTQVHEVAILPVERYSMRLVSGSSNLTATWLDVTLPVGDDLGRLYVTVTRRPGNVRYQSILCRNDSFLRMLHWLLWLQDVMMKADRHFSDQYYLTVVFL